MGQDGSVVVGEERRAAVKSAERTLGVIEFLSLQTQPTSTVTISRECRIPKSSLHNLLNLLCQRHFVTYHKRERAWSLGPRIRDRRRRASSRPCPSSPLGLQARGPSSQHRRDSPRHWLIACHGCTAAAHHDEGWTACCGP